MLLEESKEIKETEKQREEGCGSKILNLGGT